MRLSIGDASYWYEVQGTGEPVVLLHGFTGSSKTWSNYIENWASKFQVITVDLPGHGKTSIQTNRTMEECCQDLRTLFNHLSLSTIHLVGYSMGGRTALSFAMLYPDMVKTLILESASPGLASEKEKEARRKNDEKLTQRIEREGVPSFVDFWESISLFESQKKLPQRVQNLIREERISQTKEGLASSLRYMGTGSQPSWWSNLSTLSKPVLLIVGEYDRKFQLINQTMKDSLSNSHLMTIKDTGHAIHVEQPEIFGKIVTEFIFKNS